MWRVGVSGLVMVYLLLFCVLCCDFSCSITAGALTDKALLVMHQVQFFIANNGEFDVIVAAMKKAMLVLFPLKQTHAQAVLTCSQRVVSGSFRMVSLCCKTCRASASDALANRSRITSSST